MIIINARHIAINISDINCSTIWMISTLVQTVTITTVELINISVWSVTNEKSVPSIWYFTTPGVVR